VGIPPSPPPTQADLDAAFATVIVAFSNFVVALSSGNRPAMLVALDEMAVATENFNRIYEALRR